MNSIENSSLRPPPPSPPCRSSNGWRYLIQIINLKLHLHCVDGVHQPGAPLHLVDSDGRIRTALRIVNFVENDAVHGSVQDTTDYQIAQGHDRNNRPRGNRQTTCQRI